MSLLSTVAEFRAGFLEADLDPPTAVVWSSYEEWRRFLWLLTDETRGGRICGGRQREHQRDPTYGDHLQGASAGRDDMIRKFHTYTILLTLASDIPPSLGVLGDHIEQALEEGTDRHEPYQLALASVLNGSQLVGDNQRIDRIRSLHESLGVALPPAGRKEKT